MRDLQKEILDFWFEKSTPAQWFQVNEDFDTLIKQQFSSAYDLARQDILEGWIDSPEGCLAYVILLDQFPRNMFRGTAQAFETDRKAMEATKYAISKHFDRVFPAIKKRFLYLPLEHSENIDDQELCMSLFKQIKAEDPLGFEYAQRHYDVIKEFGRFPHRNAVLGRETTKEEQDWLDEHGGF